MKKIILLIGLFGWTCAGVAQQSFDLKDTIPTDPIVRSGRLSNGFQYFIRPNNRPEKRVEMRLVVKAGSLQEDNDQQGLAHFVEHMAFNGTAHFAENEIIRFLQKAGVRFGADLNAQTSFEETIYQLTLPTDSVQLLQQGYQILEDWASALQFDSLEIEKERGIIIEEWRAGLGANERLWRQYYPVAYGGSRYVERFPIGQVETIQTCSPQTLKRFYKDWYRPDLMAVVIVGDIDPAAVEQELVRRFGTLSNPTSPRKREFYNIPSHDGLRFATITDKELTQVGFSYIFKHPHQSLVTWQHVRLEMLKFCITYMLNQRFYEKQLGAELPYLSAIAAEYRPFLTLNEFALELTCAEDKILSGFKEALIELERARRFGFTASELNRAQEYLLSYYENLANEQNKMYSSSLVNRLVNQFLTARIIPTEALRWQFAQQVVKSFTLEEILSCLLANTPEQNQVLLLQAPDKEGLLLPSEAQLLETLASVKQMPLEPYQETTVAETLMEQPVKPLAIIEEKYYPEWNLTEWVLPNKTRVLAKPTDFQNDEIRMSGFCEGGYSNVNDQDYLHFLYATPLLNGGLGNLDEKAFQKFMAGKNCDVGVFASELTDNIYAYSTKKDLSLMFQMVYLRMTKPYYDETYAQNYLSRERSDEVNELRDPNTYFNKEFAKIFTQNHYTITARNDNQRWDKISLAKSFPFYQERYGNANGFTFIFVGSFTLEQLKPFVETYIATLPATTDKQGWQDLHIEPPRGIVKKEVFKGQEPLSQVHVTFYDTLQYSLQQQQTAWLLRQVLNMRLLEKLREESSGVYSPSLGLSLTRFPRGYVRSDLSFSCKPENVEWLIKQAFEVIQELQATAPSDEDLRKAQEAFKRAIEVNTKENWFWLDAISRRTFAKESFEVAPIRLFIDQIKAEDLQNLAKRCYQFDNYLQVVLYPEKFVK
ncbi:MAG TPA: hypothetical protein DCM08_00650 [Microscillaceae bacterium]|jgi:zinc protease|nr:hypothetical protein [Microscillaceae bacterium]